VRVDVVVVTFNSERHVAPCLEPLADAHDVVVVDNRSSDATVSIARTLPVRVEANDENTGFGRGANQGAAGGSNELILFLNPDARLRPEQLDRLVEVLERDPEVGVVGPALHHPDGEPQRPWWPFPSAATAWREAIGLHLVHRREPAEGFVVGACFLIRRSLFEALGGFDEDYWLYGEEADLCRRLVDLGYRVELVEDTSVEHVGGASGTTVPDVVFEHFQRGTERFVRKHAGRGALVSYRAAQVVGAAARAVAFAAAGKPEAARARRRVVARAARALVTNPMEVASS
jgi:GT2 family glycosyltransferase